jgi:hypothetical protein
MMHYQNFKECVCRTCPPNLSAHLSDDDGITGRTSEWSGVINKVVNVLIYGGILYTTCAMFSIRVTSSHIESDVGKFLVSKNVILYFCVQGICEV